MTDAPAFTEYIQDQRGILLYRWFARHGVDEWLPQVFGPVVINDDGTFTYTAYVFEDDDRGFNGRRFVVDHDRGGVQYERRTVPLGAPFTGADADLLVKSAVRMVAILGDGLGRLRRSLELIEDRDSLEAGSLRIKIEKAVEDLSRAIAAASRQPAGLYAASGGPGAPDFVPLTIVVETTTRDRDHGRKIPPHAVDRITITDPAVAEALCNRQPAGDEVMARALEIVRWSVGTVAAAWNPPLFLKVSVGTETDPAGALSGPDAVDRTAASGLPLDERGVADLLDGDRMVFPVTEMIRECAIAVVRGNDHAVLQGPPVYAWLGRDVHDCETGDRQNAPIDAA